MCESKMCESRTTELVDSGSKMCESRTTELVVRGYG